MNRFSDGVQLAVTGAVGASGSAWSLTLSGVNTALSMFILICSAIVSGYGVWKIFKEKREARAKCEHCER